jgi:hypothetical protein
MLLRFGKEASKFYDQKDLGSAFGVTFPYG